MTPRYRYPLNRCYFYWQITSNALISTKFCCKQPSSVLDKIMLYPK